MPTWRPMTLMRRHQSSRQCTRNSKRKNSWLLRLWSRASSRLLDLSDDWRGTSFRGMERQFQWSLRETNDVSYHVQSFPCMHEPYFWHYHSLSRHMCYRNRRTCWQPNFIKSGQRRPRQDARRHGRSAPVRVSADKSRDEEIVAFCPRLARQGRDD